jgi:hypothetical protein
LAAFPESYVVRVRADERTAKRIADHFLERFFEGAGAVGAFEAQDGSGTRRRIFLKRRTGMRLPPQSVRF